MGTNDERPRGGLEVRTSLVSAARRLLEHTLPGELTVRTIADEARVNSGLVYRHFGSKVALFGAVLTQIRDEYLAELDPDLDLVDQLFAPIEWIIRTPIAGRLLAWSTAEGYDPAAFGLDYQLIERATDLMAAQGVDDPEPIIAHQLAAALGWNAFEAALMHGLHDDPARIDEARERLLAYARNDLLDALSRATDRKETGTT